MALTEITNGMSTAEFISAINDNIANYGDAVNDGMLWPEILTKINSNYDDLNSMFPSSINSLSNGNGNSFKSKMNSNNNNLGLFETIEAPYMIVNNGSRLEFTMTMFNVAIYRNGVYYIAYGADYDLFTNMIITYTPATKTWSDPVFVFAGNGDHGNPVILIDDLGYIHLLCNAHSSPLEYLKSDNPYDISAWTHKADFTEGTYPSLIQMADGKFYLFYRNGAGSLWVYRTSDDRGDTWSGETSLAGSTNYWGARLDKNDRIHIFGHECNDTSINRYNQVYMYFDGTNFRNTAGDIVVYNVENDIRIYDSETKYTGFPALDFDEDNEPCFIFVLSPIAGNSTYCKYMFARKTGTSWSFYDMGVEANDILQRSFLDIKTNLVMDAYLTKGGIGTGTPYNYGGFIEKWTTVNRGVTWSFVEVVANRSLYGFLHPIDNRDELKFVFAEVANTFNGNPYLIGEEIKVYAYGEYERYQLIGHQ